MSRHQERQKVLIESIYTNFYVYIGYQLIISTDPIKQKSFVKCYPPIHATVHAI